MPNGDYWVSSGRHDITERSIKCRDSPLPCPSNSNSESNVVSQHLWSVQPLSHLDSHWVHSITEDHNKIRNLYDSYTSCQNASLHFPFDHHLMTLVGWEEKHRQLAHSWNRSPHGRRGSAYQSVVNFSWMQKPLFIHWWKKRKSWVKATK